MGISNHSAKEQEPPRWFATTHWSVVLAASEGQSPEAVAALEKLCSTYWYPLYVYVRRKGYTAEDAQDSTQEFFARLLARNYLRVADRNRGKFRSFLLGSLEHFLAREWTKARAQKRGGGVHLFSLDEAEVENLYQKEAMFELTPDKVFDRRWATTLLAQAMTRLREIYVADGKENLFIKLESLLAGEAPEGSYAAIAASLGMSEGAVKVAVHRLRERYGKLVRAEVAQTVADPAGVDEELHHLFDVLRG
jgi:RNA polymerase sigma-70 factor (ECF subfamily)